MHTAALVNVRPIDSRDRDAFSAWFGQLSDESRRRRFLGPKPRLSGRELTYLTEVDHVSHTALVAVDDVGQLIGEARYATSQPGDRIAQLVVLPITRVSLQVVDTFADSARGEGGFGHTGVR